MKLVVLLGLVFHFSSALAESVPVCDCDTPNSCSQCCISNGYNKWGCESSWDSVTGVSSTCNCGKSEMSPPKPPPSMLDLEPMPDCDCETPDNCGQCCIKKGRMEWGCASSWDSVKGVSKTCSCGAKAPSPPPMQKPMLPPGRQEFPECGCDSPDACGKCCQSKGFNEWGCASSWNSVTGMTQTCSCGNTNMFF